MPIHWRSSAQDCWWFCADGRPIKVGSRVVNNLKAFIPEFRADHWYGLSREGLLIYAGFCRSSRLSYLNLLHWLGFSAWASLFESTFTLRFVQSLYLLIQANGLFTTLLSLRIMTEGVGVIGGIRLWCHSGFYAEFSINGQIRSSSTLYFYWGQLPVVNALLPVAIVG